MVFQHFFRVIRARFGIVSLIFLTTLAATIAVSLVISKKYQAATTLVVEMRGTDPVLGGAVAMPQTITGYLITQAEVIRSERVINRVIDRLNLETNPAMLAVVPQTTDPSMPADPLRRRIATHLLNKLTVDPSREGTTISIWYEGNDPQLTADIVNAFAQSYMEISLELKTEPANNFRQWFEVQSKQYRDRLAQAQSRLTAARQASGILASDERVDVESARLAELSAQLVAIQGALAESRSRASVHRGGQEMPEVVANPLLQGLRADLSRAEARLQQLSARVGPAHPEYMAAENEVNQLKSRVQSESTRVGGSINAGFDINQRREAELRGLVEAQRAKVAKMRTARDEMQVLEREVQSAQRALDLVAQRFTETSLESQTRQSNVSVLTPAVVPKTPSRPQPVLNAVIGSIFGLFLGVVAALALESMQKPLRTSEDLLGASGVPVLAVLPPAASKRPQRLIGSTGPSVAPPSLRLGN